jgi:hypothetical protein
MPAQELAFRRQRAILWPLLTPASAGRQKFNEPLKGDPVELSVRWDDQQKEILGSNGTPVRVDAVVIVDRRIAIDSLMVKGTLSEWLGTGSATAQDPTVMQVIVFNEVPDIKNRVSYREVGLIRFRSSLP